MKSSLEIFVGVVLSLSLQWFNIFNFQKQSQTYELDVSVKAI